MKIKYSINKLALIPGCTAIYCSGKEEFLNVYKILQKQGFDFQGNSYSDERLLSVRENQKLDMFYLEPAKYLSYCDFRWHNEEGHKTYKNLIIGSDFIAKYSDK